MSVNLTPQEESTSSNAFLDLTRSGKPYLDMTGEIPRFVNRRKYPYLSRPKGYGKTTFIAALKLYFEGQREAFRGLAIDKLDTVDWTAYPVLHFDFSDWDCQSEDDVVDRFHDAVAYYEAKYGFPIEPKESFTVCLRFGNLIRRISERHNTDVVVLIDECTQPLCGMEYGSKEYDKARYFLNACYANFKSMDRYLKFALVTSTLPFSQGIPFMGKESTWDIAYFHLNHFPDMNNFYHAVGVNDGFDVIFQDWNSSEAEKSERGGE